jgi:hypothetical protein
MTFSSLPAYTAGLTSEPAPIEPTLSPEQAAWQQAIRLGLAGSDAEAHVALVTRGDSQLRRVLRATGTL